MSVCCGQQEKSQLRQQEQYLVILVAAALQQLQAPCHAGSTVFFVFPLRRNAQGLTKVFLRQPGDPAASAHQLAVKPLDDQDCLVAKPGDRCRRDRQPKCLDDLSAQPFVLHRVRGVDPPHPADETERQLDNVRGRCRAMGSTPPILPTYQSRLFLGSRNGDAKQVVVANFRRGLGRHRMQDINKLIFR
ncbi:MAG: hypothetical protein JWR21_1597 [Herminiimonas sp.]|nr:hypothetical protein [Herminiimonas sp.]